MFNSIFTPTSQPEFCETCKNRGYYALPIQPERPAGDNMMTVAFCACDAGRQFGRILKETRLQDVRAFTAPLLNSLRECENKWRKNRDEAKGIVRKCVLELEKLIEQLEKEIKVGK